MVQTKRAEINSDTAVSIAHHHRPGSRPPGGFLPSYDPKNEGAWDGQTAFPCMPAAFPLPELDNTLLTPTTWVYSLKLPLRAHSLLLAIIQRMNWDTGKGCWASVESLAEDARMSLREAARQIRWLADHGIIGRKRRRDASAETWLIMAREGEQISLPNLDTERIRSATGGRSRSAKDGRSRSATGGRLTNSSSTNQLNQKVPGLVDASKVDDSGPETRVLNSFSFEEERTGTGTVDYQAWVDSHLSEVPTDSEIKQLGKHCWPEWGPHWGGGWAAAWPTWTKDAAGRKKFRSDVVAQIQKVGLPQPMAPDADDDRARERSAAWMDQRLEEAPQRMVDVKCAGCGKSRQLPPGETRCQPCRKDLVEIAA